MRNRIKCLCKIHVSRFNTKPIFKGNRPIIDSFNKLSASGMPAKKTMLMFRK